MLKKNACLFFVVIEGVICEQAPLIGFQRGAPLLSLDGRLSLLPPLEGLLLCGGAGSEWRGMGRRAASGLHWCPSVWSSCLFPVPGSCHHLPREQRVSVWPEYLWRQNHLGSLLDLRIPAPRPDLLSQHHWGWAQESTLTDGLSVPALYTPNCENLSFRKFDFVFGVIIGANICCRFIM